MYHLTGKALYEAIGEPDLRHRRPIPPHRLAQKLMLLDLTIREPALQWLATEDQKRRFFVERGIALETLPRRVYQTAGPGLDTTRYFVDRFPIRVDETGRVGVVYPDFSGHEDAFDQFMRDHAALLIAQPSAEVLYVTAEGGTAVRAQAAYRRHIGPFGETGASLFTEFWQFCEARRRFESTWLSAEDRLAHRRALAKASRFRSEVYERLYGLFEAGKGTELVSVMYGTDRESPPVSFRHVTLPYRYYSLGYAAPAPAPQRIRRHDVTPSEGGEE